MTASGTTLAAQSETKAAAIVEPKLGPWLVIAATVFNLVLCYINTRGWAFIANIQIIVCELAIISGGLFIIRSNISSAAVRITAVMVMWLLCAWMINPGLDLEILHDVAIMYIFYKVGTLTSIKTGNRTLWAVMAIVLAFGFMEWKLQARFEQAFNIWSYYVNKGAIPVGAVNLSGTDLYASGVRGTAAVRTFFPSLFGPHRVSSVFLEPTSLGNFAAVAFAWCVSTSSGKLWLRALLFVLAIFCFILPDSRFASTTCMIMLILRFVPFARSRLAVFLLPVLVMSGLTIEGWYHETPGLLPAIITDDFPGRLLFSGRLLGYWDIQQWLGLDVSPVYTEDTGYAYFVNNLGLPLALYLLFVFAAFKPKTKEAARFKAMISVYYATALCIGASVFSIKTAALLWFLYGTTNAVGHLRAQAYSKQRLGTSVRAPPPYANEGQSA